MFRNHRHNIFNIPMSEYPTSFLAGNLLSQIQYPKDLRQLSKDQLPSLCQNLRDFIINQVSIHGGHFGASLGVIELTVALHYMLNTPEDFLVWDVGHQAYGHKILTGRRKYFHTNRVYKGLSGFPRRAESKYDAFGVGHSSTSISAALGMALASKYKKEDKQHVAVIGDGAMTAGMAFEAMNHAGVSDSNILIILNDNCMSIDPNVGALKNYLTKITVSPFYNKLRDEVWEILENFKKHGKQFQHLASRMENLVKSTLVKSSNLFEAMNLRYFGPVNGHDVKNLVKVIGDLQKINAPKLLHCITVKGKGFKHAEQNQTQWHAPGKFDVKTGTIYKPSHIVPQAPKYQVVFGETILELANKNDKIMGITPAMPSGSSLNIMMKAMPNRAIDVGIAEQHAVTVSAGMAANGLIPYCNIYSSFMQRAYDQVIHDVCIQNLKVIFCLDRAGFAGADGATHHGTYDLAYMRCLPNMIVSSPINEQELRNLMYTAQLDEQTHPFTIRYPRGQGVMVDWKTPFEKIPIGTGKQLIKGKDIAILTIGSIGNKALESIPILNKKNIYPSVYNMRFVKPLDKTLLTAIFTKYKKIITLEDGCLMGGFGTAILEFASDNNFYLPIRRLGIPDKVFEHGSQNELYNEAGYQTKHIIEAVFKSSDKEI